MSIVPERIEDFLTFCKSHADQWSGVAAGIGLSPQAALDFQTHTTEAMQAFDDKVAADDAKKAATLVSQSKIAALRTELGGLVSQIRGFATNSVDPDAVYAAAQIPAPAPREPVGPPGTPFDLRLELIQGGALKLSWKCANPANGGGTIYNIRRRSAGNPGGTWVSAGASGTRSFTDETWPTEYVTQGGIVYQITASRSTSTGNPAEFLVSFGTGAGGQMVATVVQPTNTGLRAA
ncbi:MAG: fibronectin type III domain-containing protein [Phycisphaerales bacterium]